MPSIGARLVATTAIVSSGLIVAACAQIAPSPVAKLNEAVHTRALLERRAEQISVAGDRFAVEAEAARLAGQLAAAIELSEQSVTIDPTDIGARKTLAQSYFAAGRFRAAAEAFEDLLAMEPDADNHVFGAALTALANNDRAKARALLGRLELDPARAADVGLAYVLLGEHERGQALLEATVRSGESTARTRQNLALAQAMSGDWTAARLTASIDLAPPAVEERVGQWVALAAAADAAARTTKLMRISPASTDAGRPVHLAWVAAPAADVQVADASAPGFTTDIAETPIVAEPSIEMAAVTLDIPIATPKAPKTQVAVAVAEAVPAEASVPAPVASIAVPPARLVRANTLNVAPRDPVIRAEPAPQPVTMSESVPAKSETKPVAEPVVAEAPTPVALPEPGSGNWLVQLGSYDRKEWVAENWRVLKSEADMLSAYRPIRSKTDVDGRTYFRLSVGRFDNAEDARTLCEALKAEKVGCFVREGKFSA